MEIINKEVIQSYLITTARYNFTADEKRVLTRLIEMFQPMLEGKKLVGKIEQDLFKNWHLTQPICQFITDGQNYKRVRDAIFALNDKKFIYADDKGEEVIRIVEMPKVYKRGEVEFWLNPKIVDCFLNMSKGYSKYELGVSLSFKSVYTMRLYELLASQTKPITYKIDNLKSIFGVTDKYKLNADFIRRVIKTAQTELTKKSPITFTYKVSKRGRTYDKITFSVIIQPQLQNKDVEYNKLVRRVDTSLVLGKEIYRYLKNNYEFEDRGLKNNLSLFSRAVDLLGQDEFLEKIKEIYVRARRLKKDDPRAYLVGALKMIVKD